MTDWVEPARVPDVPSKEEIIEGAQSAEEVVAQQPSVDELLGRDRRRQPRAG